MSTAIEYRVGMASRMSHLYDVEARFPVENMATLVLRLPVWTPGSYLIREYQRHLQELSFRDSEGRELPHRKIEKSAWSIETKGATQVVARYRVYAHEVTVRTAHLDHSHAFWNGGCLFLYVEALRARPARVTVDVPAGWKVSTGLDLDGGSWVATDYDALVDSPFEVGPSEPIVFSAAGKPHSLTVWGRPAAGPYDLARLTDDTRAIVEHHGAFFGGLPYSRYAFLLHLVPHAHGGLEHRASSTLLGSPFAFSTENKYQDLLELISHEFFHLWNVKRIHPDALGPFDYTREAHTRSLWVVEGWTSYYDRLALRRASLQSPARYREKLGEELTRLGNLPGRKRMSLEDSSFDAWIKLYRPDENSANSTVSYYLKGSLVALLLDLEIRRRSSGARSLDDAMRALWRDYGQRGRGYPDAAIQPLVEECAGFALDDFFARFVRGTDELDLDEPLAAFGLRAKRSGGDDEKDHKGAWLGANLHQEGDRLRVTESLTDGPAQAGGLYPGDQIVACDGWRVDESGMKERLASRKPGDRISLTVFRRDELHTVELALGERPQNKIEIVFTDEATPAAKELYRAWMNAEWGE
jgi:predicted metalloprotease with PDZ domain